MKKNKISLDLKKITIKKLNDKALEDIKGGNGTSTTASCFVDTSGGSSPVSIGSGATCIGGYVEYPPYWECLRES